MQTIVMYDVPDDRLRSRIATICEDYGMQRIQYSTFVGPMNRNRQEEAFLKIKRRVGKQEANVLLLGVCDKDLAMRMHLVVTKEQGEAGPPDAPSRHAQAGQRRRTTRAETGGERA